MKDRMIGFVLGTGFGGLLSLANTVAQEGEGNKWFHAAAAVALGGFALILLLVMLLKHGDSGQT